MTPGPRVRIPHRRTDQITIGEMDAIQQISNRMALKSFFWMELFVQVYGKNREVPFDSEHKRHAYTHRIAAGWANVKPMDDCDMCLRAIEVQIPA